MICLFFTGSSASEFSEDYISDDHTVSIQTFSQDEPASRTPNDDSLCQGEEESKNMFDNTANDQCSENPSHKTIPPRREALTPELSDDSLQGLEVPCCFDSPMFDSPISDSCFDKYFNEFFDEVQLGHREAFQPIDASLNESNTLPPVVTSEDTVSLDKTSGPLVIVEESTDENDREQRAQKTGEVLNEFGESLLKQPGDSGRIEINKAQKKKETENSGCSEEPAIEDSCELKFFNEHDYTAFLREKTPQQCFNSGSRDESEKEERKTKQQSKKEAAIKVQHPNKWLRLIDSAVNDQPIKSGVKIDPKHLGLKLNKKDPILCQPKADALNVVRVKFRAPIVERGGDRFVTVPPIKRRKKLTQHRVTDPNLSKSPSK